MKIERVLFWAFLFYLFAESADILTSVLCSHYAPWGNEANPLFQTATGIFPWRRAIVLKTIFSLGIMVPAVGFLQRAFKNSTIASFPLWMSGLEMLNTVAGNIAVLVWPWLQRIQ